MDRFQLTASTFPHLIAAAIVVRKAPFYASIITASTIASVIWHLEGMPLGPLLILDYGLAALWAITDTVIVPWSIPLNAMTVYCYLSMMDHGTWHLLSVAKSILVALILIS